MLPHSEIAATPARTPYAWRIQRFHLTTGKPEHDQVEFSPPDMNIIENLRRSWRVVVTEMVKTDDRMMACLIACEGLPQDALDGGWTAMGLSKYAQSLEAQLATTRTLLTEVVAADDAEFAKQEADRDQMVAPAPRWGAIDSIRGFLNGGAA